MLFHARCAKLARAALERVAQQKTRVALETRTAKRRAQSARGLFVAKRSELASALQDVEPAGEAVGDVDEAIRTDQDVVELDARSIRRRFGYEMGDLMRPRGIRHVEHTHASVEPRDIDRVR